LPFIGGLVREKFIPIKAGLKTVTEVQEFKVFIGLNNTWEHS
jgi:hypothetical protein